MGSFVAGDTRGSHNLPLLLPVPINTPASFLFWLYRTGRPAAREAPTWRRRGLLRPELIQG